MFIHVSSLNKPHISLILHISDYALLWLSVGQKTQLTYKTKPVGYRPLTWKAGAASGYLIIDWFSNPGLQANISQLAG